MSDILQACKVAVVIVDKNNFVQLFPSIVHAINSSTFVALDLELSGLGDKTGLAAVSIEDRYSALKDIAVTRAIIAIGISCFQQLHLGNNASNTVEQVSVLVQTFNIVTLCDEAYTVDPQSLKFLVDHGFDFNKQYSCGISFCKGNDKEKNGNARSDLLRQFMIEIIRSKKPIIVHNGLVDLAFLYQNLYLELPKKLDTFVADLSEMFTGGVYDTKYIARVLAEENATYLQYIFRKRQRENVVNRYNNKPNIVVKYCNYPESFAANIEYLDCSIISNDCEQSDLTAAAVCKTFAAYGYCSLGKDCDKSHNIDDVLNVEAQMQKCNKKTKKRKLDDHENLDKAEKNKKIERAAVNCLGIHRAGFDAYITGFTAASYSQQFCKVDQDVNKSAPIILRGIQNFQNRLHLNRKTIPLQLVKSLFAKCSPANQDKLKVILFDK